MTAADVVAAVTRALHEYAAAVDSRRWEAIDVLLADDIQLTRGAETSVGRDAFREAYRPFLESEVLGTRHVLTNVMVDETAPGAARARALFEATVLSEGATRRLLGRYEDDLVLAGGRWLFAHKRNTVEWAVDLPPATSL